ncbi:MAG: sulfotransferase [Thermomicrobiales bacterium]|nr:sulfotransferase [Thermomicrobiales bacterium]
MTGDRAMLTTVRTITRCSADKRIYAFAIDAPRRDETRDDGEIAIDGWAIGAKAQVTGIEVTTTNRRAFVPLDVARPDVAAAYPDAPEAATAGFRLSIEPGHGVGAFRLAVRARLSDGGTVDLVEIAGEAADFSPAERAAANAWPGPDFIVIGAQRSGSTSLYRYLTAHPRIAPATRKEVHYFSLHHERGRAWYRRQFPHQATLGTITGEATPYYLFHPHAPGRVRMEAPQARLLAILRNPVDRAYSHYAHEVAQGRESLSFEDAIAREPERLAAESARLAADPTFVSAIHQRWSYLARGRYAEQLRRWFELVPRDRVLVLRSEDLYTNPAATMERAALFLDLEPVWNIEPKAHNERDYPPMAATTRRDLERQFAVDNAALADLLDEPFGW